MAHQVPDMETYSNGVSCCVLAISLVILLRGVRLLQSLQFQLWGQEGTEIWDGARLRCDYWRQSQEAELVKMQHASFSNHKT